MLDAVERMGSGSSPLKPLASAAAVVRQVVLVVSAADQAQLEDIEQRIRTLAEVLETAEVSVEKLPHSSSDRSADSIPAFSSTQVSVSTGTAAGKGEERKEDGNEPATRRVLVQTPKRVVLLGAGLVAKPTVEYLTRKSRSAEQACEVPRSRSLVECPNHCSTVASPLPPPPPRSPCS